jgi:uncharacterized metal-binding protein
VKKRDKSHDYGKGPKLVYACSGVADVGAIADRAARKLNAEGSAKMSCVVGIGAGIGDILAAAKSASKITAIDGCDFDCTKQVLQQAGFNHFAHVRITDRGMPKGESPASDERVAIIADLAKSALTEEDI